MANKLSEDLAVLKERVDTMEEDVNKNVSDVEYLRASFGDKASCDIIRDNAEKGKLIYTLVLWTAGAFFGAIILVSVGIWVKSLINKSPARDSNPPAMSK